MLKLTSLEELSMVRLPMLEQWALSVLKPRAPLLVIAVSTVSAGAVSAVVV